MEHLSCGVTVACPSIRITTGSDKGTAEDANLPPFRLLFSISVNATRVGDIAGGEPDLESADRTVVPEV